nr:unnamed protein product [Naegleria fowleri]
MYEHSVRDYYTHHTERLRLQLERVCSIHENPSVNNGFVSKLEDMRSNRDWSKFHLQETSTLHQKDMNSIQYTDLLTFIQDNRMDNFRELWPAQETAKELQECMEHLGESNWEIHYSIDKYEDYLDVFSYDERPDENIYSDIQLEDVLLDFENLNSALLFFSKEILPNFDVEHHSTFRKDLLHEVCAKPSTDSVVNEMEQMCNAYPKVSQGESLINEPKNSYRTGYTLVQLFHSSFDNIVDVFSNLEDTFSDILLLINDEHSELDSSLYSVVDIADKNTLEFDIESKSESYLLLQCRPYKDYLKIEMSAHSTVLKSTDINSLLSFEEEYSHEQISSAVHEIVNTVDSTDILEEISPNVFITELQTIAISKTQEQIYVQEFWCLDSKDKEINNARNNIHFIDTIINTDDVKTIPNPLTEVTLSKCDNIIPIERIAKPKPTTNIEITLPSMWLSDKIYLFRKEIDKEGYTEILPTREDVSFQTFEHFATEEQYCPNVQDIYLNVPNHLKPSSKTRVRSEKLDKALFNLEIREKDYENMDILFIQEMFKQTSLYANTVSHYKDDGRGALYQYESLLENLLSIEEFQEHGKPNTHILQTKAGTKNHSKLEELVEENLESFMIQKKAHTYSTTQQLTSTLEKSTIDTNKENNLFIPDDIRVSKEAIDIVTDIQNQNSLLVLPAITLRSVIGLLLLQKLKKCSPSSNFIIIDSNEKRLEEDFKFYSSYLWNHTRNLIMVTKENFTFQLVKINTNCKLIFLSSHIVDNFLQRFENVISNCSFIFYQDSIVANLIERNIPSAAQVSICKVLENVYAISKKTVHSIIASFIPARSVGELISLLDAIISKRIIVKRKNITSFHKELVVELDGPISKFLCDLTKIGDFTMSGVSGVKGYDFDTMKFVEVDSDYIKHIVEDFGASLKVVMASNDQRRISETKSVFKRLVCLHTLKYLYEVILDGGISVGLSFLEKIKQSDTYNTVLEGSISDIFIRLKDLQENCSQHELDSYIDKFKVIEDNILQTLTTNSNMKILFVTKHNKVLTLLREHLQRKFSASHQIKYFTLIVGEKDMIFMRDATLNEEEPKQGFSEVLNFNSTQFHFATYTMLERIKEQRSFEAFSGFLSIVQVEPGILPLALYSLISRCMVESWVINNVLPSVTVPQDLFKCAYFVDTWSLGLQRILQTDSSTMDMEDLMSVPLRDKDISLLPDSDLNMIANNYLRDMKTTRKSIIKIIATEKCIQNSELIAELESRFLVSVVERDFVNHAPADMLINDRHCVLIASPESLDTEDTIREETINLFSKVLHLSHQFSYCWIIIEKYIDNYENSLGEIDSMTYLASSLLSFTKSLSRIEVNVKMSYSMDQTAEIISVICSDVKDQTKTLNKDILWIREHETDHESFLMQFPFINCYSAQVILQNYTLKQIASFRNFDEFAFHLGNMVAEPILSNFYQCFNEIFDGHDENANMATATDDEEFIQTSQVLINQGSSHVDHSFYINNQPMFHQDNCLGQHQPFLTPSDSYFSYPFMFGRNEQNDQSSLLSNSLLHYNSSYEEPPLKKTKASIHFPLNKQTYRYHAEETINPSIPPPSPLFQQQQTVFESNMNSFKNLAHVKSFKPNNLFQSSGMWPNPVMQATTVRSDYQFLNESSVPFNCNSKKIQTPRPNQSISNHSFKFIHEQGAIAPRQEQTVLLGPHGTYNKMPKSHFNTTMSSTPTSHFRNYF